MQNKGLSRQTSYKIDTRILYEWSKKEAPRVNEQIQTLWDTNFRMPTIYVRAHGQSHLGKVIVLSAENAAISYEVAAKHGLCDNLWQPLAGMFGEEDTHYLSVVSCPENDKKMHDLIGYGIANRDREAFLAGANIKAQVEGIGRLGSTEAWSSLFPSYDPIKEFEVLKEFARENQIAEQNRKYFSDFKTLLESTKKEDQERLYMTRGRSGLGQVARRIASSAGFKISLQFARDYAGRFPQLIRTVLDVNPSYDVYLQETLDINGGNELISILDK